MPDARCRVQCFDFQFTVHVHDSRFTIHDSRFTIHDSRFTIHDSRSRKLCVFNIHIPPQRRPIHNFEFRFLNLKQVDASCWKQYSPMSIQPVFQMACGELGNPICCRGYRKIPGIHRYVQKIRPLRQNGSGSGR